MPARSRLLAAFCLAHALVAIALPAPARSAPDVPVVAVFDILDQNGRFKQVELDQLTTYLAAQLATGEAYKVVPQSQIREALKQQKAESFKTCYDEACQIEIGRELAAQKTILTQIIVVGSSCAVTSTMYDLARAASERAATEKGACDQDSLVTALEKVAITLKGARGALAAAPPPSAAAPPGEEMATLRTSPIPPPSGATAKILVYGGWATFGLAFLGEIIGVLATDGTRGQIAASFLPVAGPLIVEAQNTPSTRNALNYVAFAFQLGGAALALIGHVLMPGDSGAIASRPPADASTSTPVALMLTGRGIRFTATF